MNKKLKEYLIKSKEKAHITFQHLVDKVLETDNINYQDGNGWCLLHWFALDYNYNQYFQFSSETILELLLKCRAKPNFQTDIGHTPLHKASYTPGSVKKVKLLLKYGADPNIKDKSNLLPIDYATKYRIQETVALLRNIYEIDRIEAKTDEETNQNKIAQVKLELKKLLK